MSTPHRPAPPHPSRFGTNTAQNCDDHVLIRCSAAARAIAGHERCCAELIARRSRRRAARRAGVRAGSRAGERLCADCTRALPWLRGGCLRCGLPAHRGRACPAARAAFPRAWAPLAYEGVARELVAALKFRGALAGRRT